MRPGDKLQDSTCQRFVELVTDYVEGALSPEEREQCETHIARCGYCAIYLDQMRQTILLLARLIDESVAPRDRDELIRRFRAGSGG